MRGGEEDQKDGRTGDRMIKKMFLVLMMVLALTGIAYATDPHNDSNATATATATGGSNNLNWTGNNYSGGNVGAITNTNTANGGAGGAGGAGGTGGTANVTNLNTPVNVFAPTVAPKITVDPNINTNIGNGIGNFSPSAKVDNKNTNTQSQSNSNSFTPSVNAEFYNNPINSQSQSTANTNTNTFNPTNTNTQGQKQGQKQQQNQGQGQGQSQNNAQTIAPTQSVVIETPQALLSSPSQSVPELNFGNGRMIDATKGLPNFALWGIKPLSTEPITEVLNVNANVKFKNLYKEVLADAKTIATAKGFNYTYVRYQIIRAEGQKSWSTGGNLGGAGSILSTGGVGGGSVAGSIIPQFGGTKADDLFTIIFVKVVR
jgi:hypothetical protein